MKIYNQEGVKLLKIEVDDNSYRNRTIMGDNTLTLYYALATHVELPVGAYVDYQGERYVLMRPEAFKMKHSRYFEYTVTMQGAHAYAEIWKFRNTVDGRLKFSLTAKPKEHLQMLVDNMNRRGSGWKVGECIDDTEQTISYDHVYCKEALGLMAEQFDTEYEISGKTISLKKVEYNKNNPLALSYGKGNGFKPDVGRSNTSETPPVEVLFVQGGDTNIDRSKYPADETLRASSNGCLLLPVGQTIGYDGVYFDDEEGYNEASARHYSVDNLGLSIFNKDRDKTSYAEDSLDRSEDYPKRVGTVSEVIEVTSGSNTFYDFTDTSIPSTLDYEKYLIDGETMTVIFQSGELAGKEFDVTYVHEAKSVNGVQKKARRFELVSQEFDGVTMPSSSFIPKAGDTYAVFGIMLPQEYFNAYTEEDPKKEGAEWDMFRTAVRYLFENEEQKFTFTGELDGIWAKKDWENIGGKIVLGGYILFTDKRFQKEGVLVRITGIKDYINKPHSPKIELSNETITPGFTSTIKTIESQEVLIEDYKKDAIQYTKRRFRDAKETIDMLEAAMTDNFTQRISPIAVETMSLLVGDERLQFEFTTSDWTTAVDCPLSYNQETKILSSNKKKMYVRHLTLGIDSISSSHGDDEYRKFTVNAYASAALTDGSISYYVYVKVGLQGATGVIVLSAESFEFVGEGCYYLLVGILNSEYEGERSFVTLYGFSEVLPGRITTERIVSGNGNSYFDMVNNAMKLGDALDFNSNQDGVLRLKGTIVQSTGGDESPLPCYRGVYNSSYTYYPGDTVSYDQDGGTRYSMYVCLLQCKGVAPTDTKYWKLQASAGTNGDWISYVFKESNTKPDTPTSTDAVPESEGWSDAPKSEGIWWMSKATISGSTGKAGTWSDPVKVTGEDGVPGAYTDFKYDKNKSTTECPSVYYPKRRDPGGNWADTPPQLDSGEYLWMIQAEINSDDTMKTDWSTPVRISGENGDWVSYVFKSSDDNPGKPTGTNPIPTGWTDAPDAVGKWWMSKATISGATGTAGDWSYPVQVTGEDGVAGAYTDFKYNKNTSTTKGPDRDADSRDPGNGWTDEPPQLNSGEYLWMIQAEIDADDNLKTKWSTPVRISGENGADGTVGTNGVGTCIAYCYYISTPKTPTGTDLVPVGWSDTPDREIFAITHKGEWTLQSDGSGYYKSPVGISDSTSSKLSYTKSVISFTTTKPYQQVIVQLKPSSQYASDYLYIGKLDTSIIEKDTNGNEVVKNYTKRVSGTSDASIIYFPIREAGSHTIEVMYLKDTEGSDNEDCAYYRIITTDDCWISFGTVDNYGNVSAWSAPKQFYTDNENEERIYLLMYGSEEPNAPYSDPYVDDYIPALNVDDYDEDDSYMTGELCRGVDGKIYYSKFNLGEGVPPVTENTDESTGKVTYTYDNDNWGAFYKKWTDNPSSVNTSYRYQFESIRVKKDGVWGGFSTPALWNYLPEDGAYYELRYQKNGSPTTAPSLTKSARNPTGWSTTAPTLSTGYYLWMTSAKISFDGSTLITQWTTPVRISGEKGENGKSPVMVFRGDWKATETYYGTENRLDCVKYTDGAYYIAQITAGTIPEGTLPTNTTYWNAFGASFESVATELLLAEFAYIENLGVRDLMTAKEGKRIHISESDNALIAYDDTDANVKISGETISSGDLFGDGTSSKMDITLTDTGSCKTICYNGAESTVKVDVGTFTFDHNGALSGSVVLNLSAAMSNLDTSKLSTHGNAVLSIVLDGKVTLGSVRIDYGANGGTDFSVIKDKTITIEDYAIFSGTHKVTICLYGTGQSAADYTNYSFSASFSNWQAVSNILMSRYFANGNAVGCSHEQYVETVIENKKVLHKMESGDAGFEFSDGKARLKIGGTWYTLSVSGGALKLTAD